MKNTFVKGCLSILFVVFASGASASGFADTTHDLLLALAKKPEEEMRILKRANVVCPGIFCGSEEQFLPYVEKFSQNRRPYLLRTWKRSQKFFPKAKLILSKHDVPAEFAVLLALESGFNANAVSGAGAVGYWQFMDEVAKEYGLRIYLKEKPTLSKRDKKIGFAQKGRLKKSGVDERKDFMKSTLAAAQYLRDRQRNLNGDWLLIAASYNCGVGNVWNAMERSGKKHPDFWDIKNLLPAETRAYVMNFIALNVIFKNFQKFENNDLCFKDVQDRKGLAAD